MAKQEEGHGSLHDPLLHYIFVKMCAQLPLTFSSLSSIPSKRRCPTNHTAANVASPAIANRFTGFAQEPFAHQTSCVCQLVAQSPELHVGRQAATCAFPRHERQFSLDLPDLLGGLEHIPLCQWARKRRASGGEAQETQARKIVNAGDRKEPYRIPVTSRIRLWA